MSKKTKIILIIVIFVLIVGGLVAGGIIIHKELKERDEEIRELKKEKKVKETEEESEKVSFGAKDFELEIGNKLPKGNENYVKIRGDGKIDEGQFRLDVSEVNTYEVGKYSYTIMNGDKVDTGIITVVDTTPPTLETKDLTIKEGDTITPDYFVKNCFDYTGCNYSFKEGDVSSKYNKVGTYELEIVAEDAYQNVTTKKAKLTIVASDDETGEYSNLKELKIGELEKMVKNKETFILVVSQTTCYHCATYKPRFNDVLKQNNLKAYYIELNLLTEDERGRLNNIANVNGTPTTVFIKNGEETSTAHRIVGSKNTSDIISSLKDRGYIK